MPEGYRPLPGEQYMHEFFSRNLTPAGFVRLVREGRGTE